MDIDKAYIMGQSYDDNGVYINWSPLFDYTNVYTLALSKQLPIPESVVLEKSDIGVDITSELNTIINNLSDEFIPINDEGRLIILQSYIQILRKINQNFGKINYDIEESDKLNYVLGQLLYHLEYIIPENIAESAYKNVASANIYTVSHDIRNRDLGYTAIAMDILKKAAKKSPKGEKASQLNMFNPLTKYIMLFQNLVGKNVISIAANGEKVWFNGYYYWTKLLKEEKGEKLKFRTTLKQVLGRAKSTPVPKTVTYLPDLNIQDDQIKQYLIDEFDLNPSTEEYAYVDLLISLLLSAATDNAKELILAKINAGTNFARMYVYLIMSGYNFDDIVSFMVSPISEFIDSMSYENMFQEESSDIRPHTAIDLALGMVKSKLFLRGYITQFDDLGNSYPIPKNKYVKNRLLENCNKIDQNKDKIKDLSLDEIMSLYILSYTKGIDINIISLSSNENMELKSYLSYCLNIGIKLRQVYLLYKSNPLLKNISFEDDTQEFKKIYNLATEISGISSAWLGLNLGIPTDELSLLKRFSAMKSVISLREKALGIFPKQMFSDTKNPSQTTIEQREIYLQKVIANIKDNNNLLSEDYIRQILEQAHKNNLIGTFDIYRYLIDDLYKKNMIEYVQLIKGTFNVLDMMEEIPLYNSIMKCLRAVAVSKYALSSKSRLISQLVKDDELDYLSDKQLVGIINYVDKLNVINFLKKNSIKVLLPKSIEGFDMYFAKLPVDIIDLTTFEGISTFKHWIENEFFSELKSDYSNNPLIKHLKLIDNDDLITLGTDIDLMNPELTSITLQSYNEILQGMTQFEAIPYNNTEHKIADLFLLYNLIININRYGSERLTTTFKVCSNPNSILNKYFKFIANLDYNHLILQDYEIRDYYINAAPIIYPKSERYQDAPFIKVRDPEKGYILKRYIEDGNYYIEHPLFPTKANDTDNASKLERWLNFAEYCPFEMPEQMKIDSLIQVLVTDNITEEQLEQIKNILLDYSGSGKLFIIRDC